MTDRVSDDPRRADLDRWRQWMLRKGEDELPSDADLRRLVTMEPVTHTDLRRAARQVPALGEHLDDLALVLGLGAFPGSSSTSETSSAPAGDDGWTTPIEAPPRRPQPDAVGGLSPVPEPTAAPLGASTSGTAEPRRAQATAPGRPDGAAASRSSPAVDDDEVDPGGFSAFTFSAPEEVVSAAASLAADDRTVTLRWQALQAPGTHVYRVVFSEAGQPYSPDDADLLTATTGTRAVDGHHKRGSVRHYAVYVNSGSDVEDAKQADAVLHATASVVLPVTDVDVRVDGAVVLGTWSAGSGAARVLVLRIPADRAATAPNDASAFGVAREQPNLTGFRDRDVDPGATYVYRVISVSMVDGVEQYAKPVMRPVTVPAPVAAVSDLVVDADPVSTDVATVTLRWTRPPIGQVVVYRTSGGPAAGADDEVDLRVENLERLGLQPSDRVSYPPTEVDGLTVMEGVSWPDGWARATFTPVTEVAGQVRVGGSVTLVRPHRILDAELVERVGWQHLTFAWPEGASLVRVYQTARDEELPSSPGPALTEIYEDTYNDDGGLRLAGSRALRTSVGSHTDLHLVPVMYYEKEAYAGTPVRVPYRGLWRLEYRFTTTTVKRQPVTQLEVLLSVGGPVPALRLIHDPLRLPLTRRQGRPVATFTHDPVPADTWVVVGEVFSLPSGFIRLFPDEMPGMPFDVAVVDPPLAQLWRHG